MLPIRKLNINPVYKVSIIILICTASLFILFKLTKLPNSQKNGFNRYLPTKTLAPLQVTKTQSPLSTIAGSTDHSIFIAGEDPRAILILNKDMSIRDTLLINLDIPIKKIVPHAIKIDSPWLYLHFNNLQKIIYGKFPAQPMDSSIVNGQIFSKSIQISPTSLIIRSIHPSFQKQTFQKIDVRSGDIIMEKDIIENQTDVGASSDGSITYDDHSGRLFYVQYLKNTFFCLDTNLNIIYTAHTIDTISSSTVNMGVQQQQNEEAKLVASQARIAVNKQCFVHDGKLFIVPALKADNEILDDFNKKTVIDIYHSSNGEYIGSFYIEKINKKSFKSINFYNDTLIALYEQNLATYKLPAYFKN